MANGRLFLECPKCQEYKLLAKYYPSSGWYPVDFSLAKWMFEHSHFIEEDEEVLMSGGEPFKLVYESSDEFEPSKCRF